MRTAELRPGADDIIVGIDLAAREHLAVIVDADGRRLTRFRVPHSREGIAELLHRSQPRKELAGRRPRLRLRGHRPRLGGSCGNPRAARRTLRDREPAGRLPPARGAAHGSHQRRYARPARGRAPRAHAGADRGASLSEFLTRVCAERGGRRLWRAKVRAAHEKATHSIVSSERLGQQRSRRAASSPATTSSRPSSRRSRPRSRRCWARSRRPAGWRPSWPQLRLGGRHHRAHGPIARYHMATIACLAHNPRLRAHYDRLVSRPQRPLAKMTALGACMNKLSLSGVRGDEAATRLRARSRVKGVRR